MSRRGWQSVVLVVGGVLILLLALFPPTYVFSARYEWRLAEEPMSLHWVFAERSAGTDRMGDGTLVHLIRAIERDTQHNLQLAIAGLTLVTAYVLFTLGAYT